MRRQQARPVKVIDIPYKPRPIWRDVIHPALEHKKRAVLVCHRRFGKTIGCINEVIMHLTVKGAPFNGSGHSGMGAYHGEWGFREFTRPKTVLEGSNKGNLPLREHPYSGAPGAIKLQILKLMEC